MGNSLKMTSVNVSKDVYRERRTVSSVFCIARCLRGLQRDYRDKVFPHLPFLHRRFMPVLSYHPRRCQYVLKNVFRGTPLRQAPAKEGAGGSSACSARAL